MKNDTDKRSRKAKRFRWYDLLPCILLIVGLGVLLYPRWTDLRYQNEVADQKQEFEQLVQEQQELENPLYEELYRELQCQNERLYQEDQKDLVDPWSYEQPGIDLTQYGLEDNVIGFLSIDAMGIELPILLGANEENMKKGAGHLTETSYPIGGENTNCVLAAHRGYHKTAMFRDIENLKLGDVIVIDNFRETLIYEVIETQVIDPSDVDELLIQDGRDLVTLLTCHPYRSNTQRYVVFCERVE